MAIGQMGPLLIQPDPASKRKRALAEQLMQQGSNAAPVRSMWEGLSRVAQGALGGYMGRKADEVDQDRQKSAQSTLASALMEGNRNPIELKDEQGNVVPAASRNMRMADILMANPDTQNMAMQYQMQDSEDQQKLADKKQERQWNLEDMTQKRSWDTEDFGKKLSAEKEMAQWKINAETQANKLAKTGHILSPEETTKYGFSPGAVVSMDAYGNPTVVQKASDVKSGGSGPFEGKGGDIQAINYYVKNGLMTAEEGAAVLGGKAFPGQNGEVQFANPLALVGRGQNSMNGSPQTGQPGLTTIREGNAQLPASEQSKIREQMSTLESLSQNINNLSDNVKNEGLITGGFGEKGGTQSSLYQNTLMGLKNLNELGVLNGPDLQLLEKQLADPTGITARVKGLNGSGYFNSQLGQVQKRISNELERAKSRLGSKHQAQQMPQQQNQGQPAQISSPQDLERLPSGSTYIAPDGSTRRKR